ncbi:MAG: hypothetical protein GY950_32420 [bacterium]|nr:hypothetical protein [bacterium]
MKCLKNNRIILYIDKALSEKEMNKIETHLAECPKCRVHLEKMTHNLQRVMQEMDRLEPGHLPAADFIPPRKTVKPFRFPNPFESLGMSFILKPAAVAMTIVIVFLLAVVIQFSGPGNGDPVPSAVEGQFSIQSIKMEDQPAQTFIVKEQETKTTLVWVEKT